MKRIFSLIFAMFSLMVACMANIAGDMEPAGVYYDGIDDEIIGDITIYYAKSNIYVKEYDTTIKAGEVIYDTKGTVGDGTEIEKYNDKYYRCWTNGQDYHENGYMLIPKSKILVKKYKLGKLNASKFRDRCVWGTGKNKSYIFIGNLGDHQLYSFNYQSNKYECKAEINKKYQKCLVIENKKDVFLIPVKGDYVDLYDWENNESQGPWYNYRTDTDSKHVDSFSFDINGNLKNDLFDDADRGCDSEDLGTVCYIPSINSLYITGEFVSLGNKVIGTNVKSNEKSALDRNEQHQDSLSMAKEAEMKANYDGYLRKITEAYNGLEQNGNPRTCDYALYDLTGDGKPELFIEYGTCEGDRKMDIFTFRDGKVILLDSSSSMHCGYHYGKNYIIEYIGHTGFYHISKLTYDGKSIIRETIATSGDKMVDNYPEVSEPSMIMSSYDKLDELKTYFKQW